MKEQETYTSVLVASVTRLAKWNQSSFSSFENKNTSSPSPQCPVD